jgi:single-stranded DNA-binding protein
MFCKNRTTLMGFIGNDAETRFTAGGLAQTRFSMATNARWKDRNPGNTGLARNGTASSYGESSPNGLAR